MSSGRKTSAIRDKELRLALAKIRAGRSTERKISFASVAREAGVSTSLIHNYHQDIAELIREATGTTRLEKSDARDKALADEKRKNKELRAENKVLAQQRSKLASINENLLAEIRALTATGGASKVVRLTPAKK